MCLLTVVNSTPPENEWRRFQLLKILYFYKLSSETYQLNVYLGVRLNGLH